MIARLSAPDAMVAVERAVRRADKRGLVVTIRERGAGFVRADVTCAGTCGMRHLIGGVHDVVLWWDLRVTCDCVARVWCGHAGALIAHEGGTLPAAPAGHAGIPNSDWRCMGCDARFATVEAARAHAVVHIVNQFTPDSSPRLAVASRDESAGSEPGVTGHKNTPAVPSTPVKRFAAAAGAAPAPSRGSDGEGAVTGVEQPPAPPTRWRTPEDAAPLVDAEHARRRRILRVVK